MYFNSLEFFIFLPFVFALFWIIPKQQNNSRNGLLLAASYIFYGWWDWRFLSLILISSFADYFISQQMQKSDIQKQRKRLLWLSIGLNIGMLMYFKYANFFIDSFVDSFTFFGGTIEASRLDIVLPVGISFYTFQTLSYSIDVYRRELKASKSMVDFFAYVSFFPQLVAGPIERATNLLPQFEKEKVFNYTSAVDGCRQILWGFFKKVVVADNCAEIANQIFNNYEAQPASSLVLGSVMFAFQIYGDFSGYSDIAIGLSRLFGFNLKKNFAFPYFSRDIAEFWRRWHISLSTWFRDYLYIPLGGSKGGNWMRLRNTFIIFLVSGFWHGPKWTFVIWGAINALLFVPLLLSNRNRKNLEVVKTRKLFPSIKDAAAILFTFVMVCFAWIFFRADNVSDAFGYITGIFDASILTVPKIEFTQYFTFVFLILFVVIEWKNRTYNYALENMGNNRYQMLNLASYTLLVFIIIVFAGSLQEFIYFQF